MTFWRFIAAGTLFACLLTLGLLVGMPHAPAVQVNQTADYTVRFAVDATSPGNRTVTVDLTPTGAPSPAVDRVVIVPTMPLDGMAAVIVTAQPTTSGRYVATEVQCAMTGVWNFAVEISAGGKEETARFTVVVR